MSGSSLLGDLNNLFTDQYFDNESEIYYYKNRYYLQDVGRFASADQLYLEEMNTRGVRPLEMNVYSYVGNDPVNMVDPSGNFSQQFQGVLNESFGRNEPGRVMNALSDAATNVGKIAGAGALAGGLGVAAPVLLSALAPKIAATSLLVTMEYNIAMIGMGQFVAKNPTMVENAIVNSIDFLDNFSGNLGAPTTGTPAQTPAGGYGWLSGVAISAGLNYLNGSGNMSSSGELEINQSQQTSDHSMPSGDK